VTTKNVADEADDTVDNKLMFGMLIIYL
jgi:hypothetical protein